LSLIVTGVQGFEKGLEGIVRIVYLGNSIQGTIDFVLLCCIYYKVNHNDIMIRSLLVGKSNPLSLFTGRTNQQHTIWFAQCLFQGAWEYNGRTKETMIITEKSRYWGSTDESECYARTRYFSIY